VKQRAEISRQLDLDEEIIDSVKGCIINGNTSKSELVKEVVKQTASSNQRVRKVLQRWTGDRYDDGHRWTYSQGEHNKFNYSLLTDPHSKT